MLVRHASLRGSRGREPETVSTTHTLFLTPSPAFPFLLCGRFGEGLGIYGDEFSLVRGMHRLNFPAELRFSTPNSPFRPWPRPEIALKGRNWVRVKSSIHVGGGAASRDRRHGGNEGAERANAFESPGVVSRGAPYNKRSLTLNQNLSTTK